MAKQILNTGPNYHKIFQDIIAHHFPNIENGYKKKVLEKRVLTTIDVVTINNFIFNETDNLNDVAKHKNNMKFKSYDKASILKMLDFQKKNNLSNKDAASYFSVSRNSIAKWKKIFYF